MRRFVEFSICGVQYWIFEKVLFLLFLDIVVVVPGREMWVCSSNGGHSRPGCETGRGNVGVLV